MGRGEAADFDFTRGLPPFDCFDEATGIVPWFVSPDAERLAAERGIPLFGPVSSLVASCHDKAFALFQRKRLSQHDRTAIEDPSFVLEPDQFADPAGLVDYLSEQVSLWPRELQSRFTIKPRLGCSGRGRLPGSIETLASESFGASLHGASRRFRKQGGGVVEPWFDRELDLSAQYWITRSGEIHFLGSLTQHLSTSGSFAGHSGTVIEPRDAEAMVCAGTRWDAELEQTSRPLVETAARAGYFGPCGVDAFVYREPQAPAGHTSKDEAVDLRFRPAVEFNARFTVGHVTLALAAIAQNQGGLRGGGHVHFHPGSLRASLPATPAPSVAPGFPFLQFEPAQSR